MAPLPTTPPLHTHVARQVGGDDDLPERTWSGSAFIMAENEQPTAAMCFAFSIVTLLVLGLLYYTGRRWEECNASNSFRRRICQRCRDNARAQAARLRHCQQAEAVDLDAKTMGKEMEESIPWHGSNMLNTSWGWMS